MKKQSRLVTLLIISILLLSSRAEAKDLYKILGIDKNASQREVQKAFHRLSLKYHPDKNPSKSAQAKFAEINNAYEVLSDEEKRKNYDLYGDEQGRARGPDPHGGNFHRANEGSEYGNSGYSMNGNNGYTFEQHVYTFGNEDGSHDEGGFFGFPGGSTHGGQGRSFSFSFGGSGSPYEDIFSSFFGSMGGNQGEGHGGRTTNSKRNNFESGMHSGSLVEELTLKTFSRQVLDERSTWAILFFPHSSNEAQEMLQLLEKISGTLKGSIKVGYVDCGKQEQLCKQQQLGSLKATKLRFYFLRNTGKMTALDYTGEWSMNDVKKYCIDILPKFSKHFNNVKSLLEAVNEENSAVAVLLTKKKDTPAIWRALSGLFYGRIAFFDAQINDDEVKATARRFQVNSLPAIIGIDGSGEVEVLSSGTQLEHSVDQLKGLLEQFEKRVKAARPKKKAEATAESEVPSLTKKNFNDVCGPDLPLCVIGVHKSDRESNKLTQILKEISRKTFIRNGQTTSSLKSPVSYGVVDATKQSAFLRSFDNSLVEGKSMVLIAYKPKKGTYTLYNGPLNLESAEKFVIEVLGGDLQLRRVLQEPVLA